MMSRAALLAALIAGFANLAAQAQQADEPSDANALPAAASEAAAAAEPQDVAEKKAPRTQAEAVLAAQAAGYKLVNKDGRELFCKKEMVTGSRLATRTRCLTLAQIEAERNAAKDMLDDMNRRSVNRPQE